VEAFQQFLAVLVVLGALFGALWAMRAKSSRFSALSLRRKSSSLKCIDRLALTPHHSLHLVRVGKLTFLIGLAPAGVNLVREVDVDHDLTAGEQ
jgi:flagellar biogenesis protein FliO